MKMRRIKQQQETNYGKYKKVQREERERERLFLLVYWPIVLIVARGRDVKAQQSRRRRRCCCCCCRTQNELWSSFLKIHTYTQTTIVCVCVCVCGVWRESFIWFVSVCALVGETHTQTELL